MKRRNNRARSQKQIAQKRRARSKSPWETLACGAPAGQIFAPAKAAGAILRATMSQPTSSIRRARREFLKFVAASPYVAALGGVSVYFAGGLFAQNSAPPSEVIGSPADALNVLDFEEAAHRKVPAGHWAYMLSGVDDDATVRANREGYQHVQLRPRRLRDATKVDTHIELFGTVYDSPIFLCPTSGHKAFAPGGESDVARAAKARGTLQILSTMTSTAVEDVNKELGRPVWQQLYAPSQWQACEKILRRAQAAGCTVIALTVDNTTGRHSETFLRLRPKNTAQCTTCHESAGSAPTPHERGRCTRDRYDGRERHQPRHGLGVCIPPAEILDREVHHQGHRHA